MENKKGLLIITTISMLILLTVAILFPRKPAEAENIQYINAMEKISDTQLGKLSPTAQVDMSVFLDTAIPYLTFEHGEDASKVALKHGYVKSIGKEVLRRNDALDILFKITGVKLPKNADLLDIAKRLEIITDKDKSLHENNKLSASEACYLIVNTKKAWHNTLESDTSKKDIDVLNFYFTASDFIFSEDGRILWYNDEGGALNALNTQDGSFSVITKPEDPELETYPEGNNTKIVNIYDNNGVLRAVQVEEYLKPGYIVDKYILYRANENDEFRKIVEFDLSTNKRYEIIGFSEDNTKLFVKTNFYDNYITIYEIDPGSESRQVVYKNRNADIVDSVIAHSIGFVSTDIFHPVTKKLLSTIYIDDKPRLVTLDDEFEKIMANVREDFDTNTFPVTVSFDLNYMVLMHRDHRDLGTYYLYNTKTRSSKVLASPQIDAESLGITLPISFKASDGETIYGYLTLPKGKKPDNLPLMVNVHSGPSSRFGWTPSVETILASDAGYAVLSVNSRISTGYGNEYIDFAVKDLLLPQKDIREAVDWAIETGIADSKNISIMGHSYGGFSALYQAGVYPSMYKSVIAMMGVWDWTDLGNELAEEEELPVWYKRFAPVPESELATVLSPSTYVDRIKMPIFIVYSGKDEVVYPSQNIRAILELSANGNTPESLYLTEEGHFPESISSRKMIISHLSEFLNNNIN
jgi:cephalosporin-C deacetylase-like acetyl esterase